MVVEKNKTLKMKKIFLITAIIYCVSMLSAQDKSDLIGKYTITEFGAEANIVRVGWESTHIMEIVLDTNNVDLIMTGIILEKLVVESIGDVFFSINRQYFMDFDSTLMSIEGFGLVKNDSIYLCYSSGGSFGFILNISVGIRKTANDTNQVNYYKNDYSDPSLTHLLGEYGISVFTKELTGNKKAYEYETNVTIASDKNGAVLTGIINELHIEPITSHFFLIEQEFYEPELLSVFGLGFVKNDSIYLYYSEVGRNDTTKSICVGTRKNATGFNSMPAGNTVLFQNSPNPFNNQTEIKYYLPENAENAVINVYSLNGNLLLTKPITQLGNGSVIINGNELEAGMYIYTLTVDGQEIDSKRMIIK